MTISEIKSRLSIQSVLAHYGLQPKGQNLTCPFHDDKKASMRVYPETNTVYCFAGSCKVSHLDVIDFIMEKEGISKHAAILKAKELAGDLPTVQTETEKYEAPPLDVGSIYTKGLNRIKENKQAREYCQSRGLDYQKLGIAYKGVQTGERWGRGCILFPLVDEEGELVSLYGRSVKGNGHYYAADRKGLYPGYPDPKTERLVITESVIDAACLIDKIDFTPLAIYGTNGWTGEHANALYRLKNLQEVVLAFDGDEAGRAGLAKAQRSIELTNPKAKITILATPEGEDVNSLVAANLDNFKKLLDQREEAPKLEPIKTPLDTRNANNLSYVTATATYEIKGGIRSGDKDLDSLKITLVVTNTQGKRSRQKLDLYEDKQVEKAARSIGERLQLRPDMIELVQDRLRDLGQCA